MKSELRPELHALDAKEDKRWVFVDNEELTLRFPPRSGLTPKFRARVALQIGGAIVPRARGKKETAGLAPSASRSAVIGFMPLPDTADGTEHMPRTDNWTQNYLLPRLVLHNALALDDAEFMSAGEGRGFEAATLADPFSTATVKGDGARRKTGTPASGQTGSSGEDQGHGITTTPGKEEGTRLGMSADGHGVEDGLDFVKRTAQALRMLAQFYGPWQQKAGTTARASGGGRRAGAGGVKTGRSGVSYIVGLITGGTLRSKYLRSNCDLALASPGAGAGADATTGSSSSKRKTKSSASSALVDKAVVDKAEARSYGQTHSLLEDVTHARGMMVRLLVWFLRRVDLAIEKAGREHAKADEGFAKEMRETKLAPAVKYVLDAGGEQYSRQQRLELLNSLEKAALAVSDSDESAWMTESILKNWADKFAEADGPSDEKQEMEIASSPVKKKRGSTGTNAQENGERKNFFVSKNFDEISARLKDNVATAVAEWKQSQGRLLGAVGAPRPAQHEKGFRRSVFDFAPSVDFGNDSGTSFLAIADQLLRLRKHIEEKRGQGREAVHEVKDPKRASASRSGAEKIDLEAEPQQPAPQEEKSTEAKLESQFLDEVWDRKLGRLSNGYPSVDNLANVLRARTVGLGAAAMRQKVAAEPDEEKKEIVRKAQSASLANLAIKNHAPSLQHLELLVAALEHVKLVTWCQPPAFPAQESKSFFRTPEWEVERVIPQRDGNARRDGEDTANTRNLLEIHVFNDAQRVEAHQKKAQDLFASKFSADEEKKASAADAEPAAKVKPGEAPGDAAGDAESSKKNDGGEVDRGPSNKKGPGMGKGFAGRKFDLVLRSAVLLRNASAASTRPNGPGADGFPSLPPTSARFWMWKTMAQTLSIELSIPGSPEPQFHEYVAQKYRIQPESESSAGPSSTIPGSLGRIEFLGLDFLSHRLMRSAADVHWRAGYQTSNDDHRESVAMLSRSWTQLEAHAHYEVCAHDDEHDPPFCAAKKLEHILHIAMLWGRQGKLLASMQMQEPIHHSDSSASTTGASDGASASVLGRQQDDARPRPEESESPGTDSHSVRHDNERRPRVPLSMSDLVTFFTLLKVSAEFFEPALEGAAAFIQGGRMEGVIEETLLSHLQYFWLQDKLRPHTVRHSASDREKVLCIHKLVRAVTRDAELVTPYSKPAKMPEDHEQTEDNTGVDGARPVTEEDEIQKQLKSVFAPTHYSYNDLESLEGLFRLARSAAVSALDEVWQFFTLFTDPKSRTALLPEVSVTLPVCTSPRNPDCSKEHVLRRRSTVLLDRIFTHIHFLESEERRSRLLNGLSPSAALGNSFRHAASANSALADLNKQLVVQVLHHVAKTPWLDRVLPIPKISIWPKKEDANASTPTRSEQDARKMKAELGKVGEILAQRERILQLLWQLAKFWSMSEVLALVDRFKDQEVSVSASCAEGILKLLRDYQIADSWEPVAHRTKAAAGGRMYFNLVTPRLPSQDEAEMERMKQASKALERHGSVVEFLARTKPDEWHGALHAEFVRILFPGSSALTDVQVASHLQSQAWMMASGKQKQPAIILGNAKELLVAEAKQVREFQGNTNAGSGKKLSDNWAASDYTEWAEQVRRGRQFLGGRTVTRVEMLAVVARNYKRRNVVFPRDVQLYAILAQLDADEAAAASKGIQKGRLGQVPTGEGKTLIVAILATILALQGRKVDVIASSSELAQPQQKELASFFSDFGLKSDVVLTERKTDFANASIVYGSAADFQWADLRYRFKGEPGARNEETRPYEVAIVDETDALMVDAKDAQALMSTIIPGYHHLQIWFAFAWMQMNVAKQHLRQFLVPVSSGGGGGRGNGGNNGTHQGQGEEEGREGDDDDAEGGDDRDHEEAGDTEAEQDRSDPGAADEADSLTRTKRWLTFIVHDPNFPKCDSFEEFQATWWKLSKGKDWITAASAVEMQRQGQHGDGALLYGSWLGFIVQHVERMLRVAARDFEYRENSNLPKKKRGLTPEEEKELKMLDEGKDADGKEVGAEQLAKLKQSWPKIHYMPHMHDFIVKTGIPAWSRSVVAARFLYRDGVQYQYDRNKQRLYTVDAENTGCVADNQTYSDGVHQFLELKHGLRMTPLSLTSNYMSSVHFFRKCDRIFGLTGTLGDAETQELMQDTYELDFFFLPSHKSKQFYELRPLVVYPVETQVWAPGIAAVQGDQAAPAPAYLHSNKHNWQETVISLNIAHAVRGRAVLVICESIAVADKMYMAFASAIGDKKNDNEGLEPSSAERINLYEYTMQAERERAVGGRIAEPGDIIIATNIAGRGTDITLEKAVERNGGLHVCVTFLPANARVQEQNFGRTSRAGNRGTAQLIVDGTRLGALIGGAQHPDAVAPTEAISRVEVEEKEQLAEVADGSVTLKAAGWRFAPLPIEEDSMEIILANRDAAHRQTIVVEAPGQVRQTLKKDLLFDKFLELLDDLKLRHSHSASGNENPGTLGSFALAPFNTRDALEENFSLFVAAADDELKTKFTDDSVVTWFESEFAAPLRDAVKNRNEFAVVKNPYHLLKAGNWDLARSSPGRDDEPHLREIKKRHLHRAMQTLLAGFKLAKETEGLCPELFYSCGFAHLAVDSFQRSDRNADESCPLNCFPWAIKIIEDKILPQLDVTDACTRANEDRDVVRKEVLKRHTDNKREIYMAMMREMKKIIGDPTRAVEYRREQLDTAEKETQERKEMCEASIAEAEKHKDDDNFMQNWADQVDESGPKKEADDGETAADGDEEEAPPGTWGERIATYILHQKLVPQKMLQSLDEKLKDIQEQRARHGAIGKMVYREPLVDVEWEKRKKWMQKNEGFRNQYEQMVEGKLRWVQRRNEENASEEKEWELIFRSVRLLDTSGCGFSEMFGPERDGRVLEPELREAAEYGGLIGSFELEVKHTRPVDHVAFWSLLILGVLQIVAGALLVVFSSGAAASIGLGLISEGVSDIICAVKDVHINKNFDWKSWGVNKVVSLAVSMISAGMGAVKEAAAVTRCVACNACGPIPWAAFGKVVAVHVFKDGAQQLGSWAVQTQVVERIMTGIEQAIENDIRRRLQKFLGESADVRALYEADAQNGSRVFANKLTEAVHRMLTPFENSKGIKEAIVSFGGEMCGDSEWVRGLLDFSTALSHALDCKAKGRQGNEHFVVNAVKLWQDGAEAVWAAQKIIAVANELVPCLQEAARTLAAEQAVIANYAKEIYASATKEVDTNRRQERGQGGTSCDGEEDEREGRLKAIFDEARKIATERHTSFKGAYNHGKPRARTEGEAKSSAAADCKGRCQQGVPAIQRKAPLVAEEEAEFNAEEGAQAIEHVIQAADPKEEAPHLAERAARYMKSEISARVVGPIIHTVQGYAFQEAVKKFDEKFQTSKIIQEQQGKNRQRYAVGAFQCKHQEALVKVVNAGENKRREKAMLAHWKKQRAEGKWAREKEPNIQDARKLIKCQNEECQANLAAQIKGGEKGDLVTMGLLAVLEGAPIEVYDVNIQHLQKAGGRMPGSKPVQLVYMVLGDGSPHLMLRKDFVMKCGGKVPGNAAEAGKVDGSGKAGRNNCLYAAVAKARYGDPNRAEELRKKVAAFAAKAPPEIMGPLAVEARRQKFYEAGAAGDHRPEKMAAVFIALDGVGGKLMQEAAHDIQEHHAEVWKNVQEWLQKKPADAVLGGANGLRFFADKGEHKWHLSLKESCVLF
eukprot:g10264.t1